MAYKFDRYRDATRILARCLRSDLSRRKIPASYGTIWLQQWQTTRNLMVEMREHIQRSSTLPETHNNFVYREEISSFIKSSFNEPEGCISVDEDGNRIFISDSNHHRIIIANGEGKILDCIGSSPGFEDGEFESAKLLRPGASFYDIAENCLYIVDSENHAVRRADLEKRALETIYPVTERKSSSIWNWLLVKIGLSREVYTEPEPFDLDLIKFPWHLVMLDDKDLLIINRSFETAWVMKMETGEIKEVLKDKSCILKACEHMAVEKMTLLKDIQGSWLQPSLDHSLSVGRVPYAGLISSVAKFHKNTFFCDSACHRVIKYDGESRSISYFQFSALGVLGLPYWLICPLERVSNREYLCKPWHEHLHYFTVLPGSCNIQVNIDIPKGTELAASLEEGSIWRQGRGSVVVLNGSEGEAASAEKVGIAQQWYDELDDLAFSKPEMESSLPDERCTDTGFEDMSKVHFNCPIDISPGTSEVVVSMVLYLKLQKGQDTGEAWRILDLGKPDSRKLEDEDARVRFLLETYGDLRDVVFMKPLHLRIRLDCGDHPTAATTKETITVDSTIDVNLPLN